MRLLILTTFLLLGNFLTAQQTSVRLGAGLAGFPQSTVGVGSSANIGLLRDFKSKGPLGTYVTAGVSRNSYTDRSAFVPYDVPENGFRCLCILAQYNTYDITRNEVMIGGGLKYDYNRFSLRAGATLGFSFAGELTEKRYSNGEESRRILTTTPGERYEEFGRRTEASLGYNRLINPVADLALSYRLTNRFSVGLRYQETIGRYRITRTRYNACPFCRPSRGNSIWEIGNARIRSLQVALTYHPGQK